MMAAVNVKGRGGSSSRRRVTVYAMSTAVSASPVQPGKTYPLSTLDHSMASHRVSLVFYYKAGPTVDREAIKESLTEVLTHYPAMMGRLYREKEGEREGRWVVKCNDAGVRLLDARVKGVTLEEWTETATAADEMELTYWEDMNEEVFLWSPFYIQITEFEDRAYAIGLSCAHMHADPTCAILFIKAWGDAHRRACIAIPPFFHPPGLVPRPDPNLSTRSADFLNSKSSRLASSSSTTPAGGHMSTATFRFSEESVKSCLAEVNATCPADTPTPFDVLASLFWIRVRNAASAADQATVPPEALTLCVDFRKSMHAPLPHGFYGNALHFSKVEADLASGWGHVASALSRHVAGLEEEEYWSAIDWFWSRGPAKPFQMYGPELTCVKLDHVFAYGAVFDKESGKPVHVACRLGGVEGEGVVLVMPAPEEGMARTVVVTLPVEVMEKVCKDDAILKHGPKVMFRG